MFGASVSGIHQKAFENELQGKGDLFLLYFTFFVLDISMVDHVS